jgi:hypothetical protein
MDDAFHMRGVKRVRDFDTDIQQLLPSIGLLAMTCFRVTPSRYSIAMKALPASSPMS